MAIFPIVFGSQLAPGAGPGLIFQTLPIAFSTMPAGAFIGTLFFVMLVIAAFTSAIAMIESSVAFCEERFGLSRWRATFLAAGRSEEHTSELQSRPHLVCRLLLE